MDQQARDKRAEEKKVLEQTLGISFCKLLEEHPLYDSRVEGKLSVLLIGRGRCLELLRDKILSNGQLLNTELEVTILTDDPDRDRALLVEDAPDLSRFADLGCDPERLEVAQPWATVRYVHSGLTLEALKGAPECYDSHRYVLISLGDPDQNRSAADYFLGNKHCVTAYVHGSDKHAQLIWMPRKHADSPYFGKGAQYENLIEPVAYNLHHAYTRGNDPFATDEKIQGEFYGDDAKSRYNYESNFECALHIQSKLRCCGIDTTDPKMAVVQFEKMLREDHEGVLVNELAYLEHRRWCMSKLTQNFVKPAGLDKIFSSRKIDTHSKEDKWHIALVPYGKPGTCRSALEEQDWIAEDPEGIPELGELDKQTLRVHKKCAELTRNVFEDSTIALERIRELTQEPHLRNAAYALDRTLEELRKGNMRIHRTYEKTANELHEYLEQQDAGFENLTEIQDLLDGINNKLRAWYEFVTRKDYKEQNRVLVRNIPFALSPWRNMILVKLMSDNVDDCVNSVWQLAPSRVVFVDYAATMEDMIRIRRQAKRVNHFLELHGKDVMADYRVFVSGEASGIKASYPEFFESWDCEIQPVGSAHADEIRPWFVSLIHKCEADYIDMTGGKPELIGVAQEFARNSQVGAFVIRDGKIRDYYGAEGINGQILNKEMTVAQIFDRAGAKKHKQDDDKLTGNMLNQCEKFWEIAHKHRKHWNQFCFKFFSPACRMMEAAVGKKNWDGKSVDRKFFEEAEKGKSEEDRSVFQEIMDALNDVGLFKLETVDGTERYAAAEKDFLSVLRNSGKVLEYRIYCMARRQFGDDRVALSWQFWHDWDDRDSAQNEVDVICSRDMGSLFISAKFVSMDTIESNGFINHVCYEVCEVADHFGLNAKKILAAPNVPQFDPEQPTELSRYVKHAMSRGVYLLGDVCFEGDRLGQVLENIAADKEKWYRVDA